ncbi:MAG: hypothetical protein EOS55_04360 [Mesorhizobium sp.]|nr:MAG: hypothetical protein EOS55_04360 [Mesorhizobium sp.]
MLDQAAKWDAAPSWATAALTGKRVTARSLDLPDQALVSGDLTAFGQIAGLAWQGEGALGPVLGETFTVRLARDRLLAVGRLHEAVSEGWNAAGFAATAIGGANHVFELTGEGVEDLLSRATTLDLANPGPSAAASFAGVPAIVYRFSPSGGTRLHVERGLAVYVWTWLRTVLEE